MERLRNSHPPGKRRKRGAWEVAAYASTAILVAIVLAGVFLFHSLPDIMVNRFVKARIAKEFTKAYPAYSIQIDGMHYNVRENRVGFDSVALTTRDSSLSLTIAAYSVSGIGWLELLLARGLVPNGFTGTVLEAHGIVAYFQQEQYELRCERLRVSVPDSDIIVEALELHPFCNDELFFAKSKFRKTRFSIVVPYATVVGLACLELLQGKMYRTRAVHLRDVFIDVLINKDKPVAKGGANPLMPNEILGLVEKSIKVDSVNIWNGGIQYGERFAVGSKAAVVTLDSIQVSVRAIENHGDVNDTTVVRAEGIFMKSAEVKLLLLMPISSPGFSLQCSGSVSRMKLSDLNPFVEVADGTRFKSGILQAAKFDMNVVAGSAGGSVRAVYKDLAVALINKHSGSERGIANMIASFVANNMKIRRNNISGYSGTMKIGKVQYVRQRDDPFFRFVWFALRSGVSDIVGL